MTFKSAPLHFKRKPLEILEIMGKIFDAILLGAFVANIFLSPEGARAQSTSGSDGIEKPHAMARGADPDWEVVTVKPSDPKDSAGQHIRFRGRHVMLLDHTVEDILLIGYGVQRIQIVDAPEWVRTERFDVDGMPDTDGDPSLRQLQVMMQKILLERFGLRLHHAQREMSVYALSVGKHGPKITANASDPNRWMDQQNQDSNGTHIEKLKNTSMPELALILQFHVDRPVVDQTGLQGKYDFELKWATDEAQGPPDGSAPPGLFTAIQEQIGLKLDPVRANADALVIDHVDRPSPN